MREISIFLNGKSRNVPGKPSARYVPDKLSALNVPGKLSTRNVPGKLSALLGEIIRTPANLT